MAKHRRHKKHEDHIDESWLVPYADILTLLLALFIVLFAMSSVDQDKLDRMSEVFNEIFDSGEGVAKINAPIELVEESDEGNDNEKDPISEIAQEFIEDQAQLKKIKEQIDNLVMQFNVGGQFDTKMTDDGLLITIRDSLLFNVGSSEINKGLEPMLKEMSRVLEFQPERNIMITGHTDNTPMNNERYKSNYELSVDRAGNFMKELILSNPDLNVKKISVKGLGEIEPLAKNETEEGRAMNRRVEILIQPNASYKKEYELNEAK